MLITFFTRHMLSFDFILDLQIDLFRPFIGFREIRVVHKEPRRVSFHLFL